MPRGLSPLGIRNSAVSYAAPALSSLNPWLPDASLKRACSFGGSEQAKRPCIRPDGLLLPEAPPLELPAPKRRCLGPSAGGLQEEALELPVPRSSPKEEQHRRGALSDLEEQDCKKRRLAMEESDWEDSALDDEANQPPEDTSLALVPAKSGHRSLTKLELLSCGHSKILDCICDAFSSSWEPTIQPMQPYPRPWILNEDDGSDLPNLIIFKDGSHCDKQVCVWPKKSSSSSSSAATSQACEKSSEERGLEGHIIFGRPEEELSASRVAGVPTASSVCIEEVEEDEEVPMEA